MGKLSPSLLSANFSRLGEDAVTVTGLGADYLHVDVMDGHFVPNISFGASVMKSLNALETAPYDVHLMISDPDKYIEDFVTGKTKYITVHQEATIHLNRTLNYIKSLGIGAGVAINPGTPVEAISEVLFDADLVLVMSVNPGFGGQAFIPNAINKIKKLAAMREEAGLDFLIEVDGGVNPENGRTLIEAGTDILVAGSSIFGAEDIKKRMEEFKKIL